MLSTNGNSLKVFLYLYIRRYGGRVLSIHTIKWKLLKKIIINILMLSADYVCVCVLIHFHNYNT